MRQPTTFEEKLAAERVYELARSGLAGGIAVFSDGLGHVMRCGKPWRNAIDAAADEIQVRIPDPLACESDAELADACRYEVVEGIFDRDRRCRLMIASLHLDLGDNETALTLVGGIEDETERCSWERRLMEAES